MPIPNVFTQQFEYDDADPAGYRAGVTLIGKAAGGRDNIVKEFEVPPGESVCPYHYEYEEEWLLLLEGAVILRTPQGERTTERGDLVCFPPGPGGAHKLTNGGDRVAIALMWSSAREPSVAIYPDSDKMGVWAGEDKAMLRRADGHADYRRGNLTSDVTAGTQAGSRPAPGRRPPGTQAGSLPRPRPAMPPGAPVRSVRRRPS